MTDKQIQFWVECIDKHRKDFDNEKMLLAEKFGGLPKDEDIIWSLLNKYVLDIPKYDINRINKMITTYDLMANFLLTFENKDPIELIRQKRKLELQKIKEVGIYTKVKIGTLHEGICTTAKKMKDKSYSIDEAIKQMPIPFPNCKNRALHKKIKVCTCYYVPLTDDEF